jgi:hypothetical protein
VVHGINHTVIAMNVGSRMTTNRVLRLFALGVLADDELHRVLRG